MVLFLAKIIIILFWKIEKCIQLHRTLESRHSVMLIGDTQSGKSTIMSILTKYYEMYANKSIKLRTLNPKERSVSELYGVLDPYTRDWKDGLLSKIFRYEKIVDIIFIKQFNINIYIYILRKRFTKDAFMIIHI